MLAQRKPPTTVPYVQNLVCFRYVSRGTNVETLKGAVQTVRTHMERFPLFPYIVEAVVENPVGFDDPDVIEIIVPKDYETPNGTLFKARGLHYAMENSTLSDDTWIFHCDEESQVTESLILGIAQAVAEEERSGEHRIGQGCVLYYRTLDDHPVLTLADSIRTGDDLGRWNLQNRVFGLPLLGMHGSFILVRNSVEKEIGFDHGAESSVTEDAWWALCAAEVGYRTRWVDGFLTEQAPERVKDFVKQRRRWITGLARVAIYAPVRFTYRLPLLASMLAWTLGPLALLWTVADAVLGVPAPKPAQILGDLGFACFTTIYVMGLRMNLRSSRRGPLKSGLLYLGQVLLMPLFALLEVSGAAYAIVKPQLDFHVIQKRH
jgi:egghead protein (zeste-white 4 protein)